MVTIRKGYVDAPTGQVHYRDTVEGVPLLLEEVTRGTLESASHEGPVAAHAAGPTAVPTPLQLIVESRLGRLPDLEAIVQAASVLGREFSVEIGYQELTVGLIELGGLSAHSFFPAAWAGSTRWPSSKYGASTSRRLLRARARRDLMAEGESSMISPISA